MRTVLYLFHWFPKIRIKMTFSYLHRFLEGGDRKKRHHNLYNQGKYFYIPGACNAMLYGLSSTIVSKASAIRLAVQSNVQEYSVFFWARNGKSGREAVFWSYFDFFLGQKSAFSPTFSRFFGSFLAHFWISRPLFFDFFLGLTINFLGHNSEIFLRQKYFFSRSL